MKLQALNLELEDYFTRNDIKFDVEDQDLKVQKKKLEQFLSNCEEGEYFSMSFRIKLDNGMPQYIANKRILFDVLNAEQIKFFLENQAKGRRISIEELNLNVHQINKIKLTML